MRSIPVNTPLLSGNESQYLQECIDTGWISSEGPFIERFEKAFASYIGKKHGIAVSSGSAALDIAIAALELGPGDEIILPAFTIISPAFSVVRAGATPVLVDSEPDTWNMNVKEVESKITTQTKAIIVVHIYGLPVDLEPLLRLCKKHNLKLIEDVAEVIGQTYYERKCGSFGDISTFSFYPNKHITTGEGGMCLTDDEELAERCRKLKNLAFEPNHRRFVHLEMGWNYRMTNMQAALGLAQLEKIDEHLEIKRQVGERYHRLLNGLQGFILPLPETPYSKNIFWIFGLLAESYLFKEKMVAYLSQNKIGTRPFFWPLHEQPVFRKMELFKGESYPISEKLARNGFYIPSGLSTTIDDIDHIADIMRKFTSLSI